MRRQFYSFVMIASWVLMVCRAPYAQHRGMAGDSAINPERVLVHKPFAGVPNFGEVNKTLYRGGQPSKKGFEALAKMGIGIVVDLRASRESERKHVTSLGMQYVPIPWRCFRPQDEVFARFLALLRENPRKKVFVHCRVGDDRTGMMIAAYRMAEQGWTAAEARAEMEEYGFTWLHRHLICPGLASYEESFPKRLNSSPAFQGPARKRARRSSSLPFNLQLPYLLLPSS